MSDVEEAPAFDPTATKSKKKSKKAVAFAGEAEENGTEPTAEAHSLKTEDGDDDDAAVDEVTEMFKDLKKKKKKSKKTEGDEEAEEGADGELDLTKKRRKKKKPTKTEGGIDAFDAQLAEAGVLPSGDKAVGEAGSDDEKKADVKPEDAGDPLAGTGVWATDSTAELTYPLLLSRFFTLLRSQHPDFAGEGRKSYRIPPPQAMREGNKKTIFANIHEICKRMKRHDEHVIQFLFAELGTSGSVDGSKRLVIKGKFQQKQLENVLRRYIMEYVTCKTCKSADTELNKGENRLFFITCNTCGSRRSVAAIKTGFQATIGKRRRLRMG